MFGLAQHVLLAVRVGGQFDAFVDHHGFLHVLVAQTFVFGLQEAIFIFEIVNDRFQFVALFVIECRDVVRRFLSCHTVQISAVPGDDAVLVGSG